MKRTLSFLAAAGICLTASVAQAREVRTETVHFEPGRHEAKLEDHIIGHGVVSYHVRVHAGETFHVTLDATNSSTYFNVYEPGKGPGDVAIGSSDRTSDTVPEINRFEYRSDVTGDYNITVFMVRAAARRGEESIYDLDVTIGDVQIPDTTVLATSGDPVRGPEYLEVDVHSRLRVHAEPSTASDTVLHAADGTVLRNLGCFSGADRTWCHVERPSDGLTGYAAAAYLRGETAALTSLAGVEDTPYGHESGWNILVRPDVGNGCLAEVQRDGVQVQIGFNPADETTYLAVFTREHIGISNHEHMAVLFDLDGDEFIGDATTETRPGFEGGYVHITNPNFLMDLAEKETMTVFPAGLAPFAVSLKGSKRAIGKLMECQLAHF